MKLALSILFAALQCWGATWYVDVLGSNLNDGTSTNTPWRTAYYAGTNASVQPGDTVEFLTGVFTNKAWITRSGVPGSNVTYKAYSGAIVTNKQSWHLACSNVTIQGMEFTGGGGDWYYGMDAIEIDSVGAKNLLITGNTFHDIPGGWKCAVTCVSTGSPGAISVVVSNNTIRDCGPLSDAVITPRGSNWIVTDNIISNICADAFRPRGGWHVFRRNRLYEFGDALVRIYGAGNADFNGWYDWSTYHYTNWSKGWVHTNSLGYAFVDGESSWAARGWSNRYNLVSPDGTTNYASTGTSYTGWTMHDTNIVSAPTWSLAYMDHPDFIDCADGGTATNITIEQNWVECNIVSQISQLCCLTTNQPPIVQDFTFRNNVFINMDKATVNTRNTRFINNVFLRCSATENVSPLAYGWYNPTNYDGDPDNYRGEAYGGVIVGNCFLACAQGSTIAAWYSGSGYAGMNPPVDIYTNANFNYVCSSTNTWGAVAQGTYPGEAWKWYEPNGINGGNPGFFNVHAWQFWLTNGSALIDAGTNATTTDYLGWSRPMGTTNDIGAYEFDPNLRVWFTFDDSFTTTSNLLDNTGYGHTAYCGNPTNWITSTAGKSGNAGQWSQVGWMTNDYPNWYVLSQYAYVTNLANIEFITNGTIAFWVQWGLVDGSGGCQRGATIVDTGGGYTEVSATNKYAWTNCYRIAYGPPEGTAIGPLFYRHGMDTSYPTNLAQFSQSRDASTWYHVAVVWDAGSDTVIGYQDGLPIVTNDFPFEFLRVSGRYAAPPLASDAIPWLCIGASTHAGSLTWGDDNYPNDGYFVGKMDEIRIYDRALTAAEVPVLMQTGYTAAAEEDEEEPAQTNITHRVGTLRIQTLRQR